MYDKEIKLRKDKTLGYFYFIDKEHPLAHWQGKVYYHRHVASLKIGRWLRDEECAHHIDGDKENNDPDNICICFLSEHTRNHKQKEEPVEVSCAACGKSILVNPKRKTRFCSRACSDPASRRFKVTKEELHTLVWSVPTTKVAEKFGVSDSAIAKRCKLLGVKKPPRGYWAKKQAEKNP